MAKAGKTKDDAVFSAEERAAMSEAHKERKKGGKANGEADLLAKIAEMDAADRAMAEAIHAIVTAHAPQLSPKTWYGMPAWANGEGKVVCFFTAAGKFKTRYASFGFQEAARLDDGTMWPTAFAVTGLTDADKQRIAALVSKASG